MFPTLTAGSERVVQLNQEFKSAQTCESAKREFILNTKGKVAQSSTAFCMSVTVIDKK